MFVPLPLAGLSAEEIRRMASVPCPRRKGRRDEKIMRPGTLYVVSTPIGNVEDLTLRAIRVLTNVAVIAAEDPQETRSLCERHGIHTPLTSYHNENKEEKAAVLLARLGEGDSVALVSDAGTPVIADPGRFLVQQAIAAAIPVTPVPGPSAVLAAIAVSGLSGDRFLFLGALPRTSGAIHRRLRALRKEPGTLILLSSAESLRKTLQAIRATLGDRYVAVTQDLTTAGETCSHGKTSGIMERLSTAPACGAVTLVIEGYREKGIRNRKKPQCLTKRRVSES